MPAYLTVQFVRFQYKAKDGINAKVLKDIKFPVEFDAFELCTPALQEKLTPVRLQFKDMEDANLLKAAKLKENPKGVEEVKEVTKVEPFSFPDGLFFSPLSFYDILD